MRRRNLWRVEPVHADGLFGALKTHHTVFLMLEPCCSRLLGVGAPAPKVLLLAYSICLAEPRSKLLIDFAEVTEPERMEVIARRERLDLPNG